MVAMPKQLFARAKNCGLLCIPCEKGNHRIQPIAENPDWELILQRGVWMLVVRETPQIRFCYEEAMAFLDRVDRKEHLVVQKTPETLINQGFLPRQQIQDFSRD